MKELVLLRHGHALGTREAGVTGDHERPLSERGQQAVRGAAARLRDSGFKPGLIIASPFKRAQMTADIAVEIFPGTEVQLCHGLSDGDAEVVLKALLAAANPPGTGLLVVGHQPLLGALAGYFLGVDDFSLSPAGFVRFRTAGQALTAGPENTLVEHYSPPGAAF